METEQPKGQSSLQSHFSETLFRQAMSIWKNLRPSCVSSLFLCVYVFEPFNITSITRLTQLFLLYLSPRTLWRIHSSSHLTAPLKEKFISSDWGKIIMQATSDKLMQIPQILGYNDYPLIWLLHWLLHMPRKAQNTICLAGLEYVQDTAGPCFPGPETGRVLGEDSVVWHNENTACDWNRAGKTGPLSFVLSTCMMTPHIIDLPRYCEYLSQIGAAEARCRCKLAFRVLRYAESDDLSFWNPEVNKISPGKFGRAIYCVRQSYFTSSWDNSRAVWLSTEASVLKVWKAEMRSCCPESLPYAAVATLSKHFGLKVALPKAFCRSQLTCHPKSEAKRMKSLCWQRK